MTAFSLNTIAGLRFHGPCLCHTIQCCPRAMGLSSHRWTIGRIPLQYPWKQPGSLLWASSTHGLLPQHHFCALRLSDAALYSPPTHTASEQYTQHRSNIHSSAIQRKINRPLTPHRQLYLQMYAS